MQILMGGSGSTGSSLLKNILNRHPEIFAGGETEFFSKDLVYKNWKKARKRLLKRGPKGMRNFGFHMYNGTDLVQDSYLWGKDELKRTAKTSNSLKDFSSKFFSRGIEANDAKYWLEKTPSNATCFSMFLKFFPEGKVIHIVRNPYDTIASLHHRGFTMSYAVGIYLINTAAGLTLKAHPRVYTIKYEDLTSHPPQEIGKLCAFLGIDYVPKMLIPQGEKVSESQMQGWKYDQTKAVGKGSVGRFKKISLQQ